MKIALYKSVKNKWLIPMEFNEQMEHSKDCIRVSDFVNVEFNMLDDLVLNQQEADAINDKIRDAKLEIDRLESSKLAIGSDQ